MNRPSVIACFCLLSLPAWGQDNPAATLEQSPRDETTPEDETSPPPEAVPKEAEPLTETTPTNEESSADGAPPKTEVESPPPRSTTPAPAPTPARPAPTAPSPGSPTDGAKTSNVTQDERVLVLQFSPGKVDPATVQVLNELVVAELNNATEREILTYSEIENLVDLETSRAAMTCDASACLAEVSGALGVRYVVFGSVGQLGTRTVLSMSLYDSDKASNISRETVRVDDIADFEQALRPGVFKLIAPLEKGLVIPPSDAPHEEDSGSPLLLYSGLGIVGVGAVAAIAGVVVFVASEAALFAMTDVGTGVKTAAVFGEISGPSIFVGGALMMLGGGGFAVMGLLGGDDE